MNDTLLDKVMECIIHIVLPVLFLIFLSLSALNYLHNIEINEIKKLDQETRIVNLENEVRDLKINLVKAGIRKEK